MTVPYYGVARGIEQALMENYGFEAVSKNFNRDRPENERVPLTDQDRNPRALGVPSGVAPTLTNAINSITPRQSRAVYCSLTSGGLASLRFLAASVSTNVPHGWNANFPQRDCEPWLALRTGTIAGGGSQ
jgi:hypothetical protein